MRRSIAKGLVLALVTAGLQVVAAPSSSAVRPPPRQAGPMPSVAVHEVPGTEVERPADQAAADAVTGEDVAAGARAAGADDPAGSGDPTATPLSASGSWSAGGSSGGFGWSYSFRATPGPGGLEPSLALSYSSQAVDGRTSATNNQTSWVGEGWELSPGFIERSYRPCNDDKEGVTPPKVGDLCWATDNATLTLSGAGGPLVADANGRWHTKNDDGSRIERLRGVANGDGDKEYWKVTTTDGTQYFFGSRPASKSTWTVPVYGDDPGEPCHGDGFAGSSCTQAWRWNLDYVVDRNGNALAYHYETETNHYGQNLNKTAAEYVRGGYLTRVDYGLRDGSSDPAVGRVSFTVADRCLPDSSCDPDDAAAWPDVPWTQRCTGTPCKDSQVSPTFWTTKRLSKVTTQVLSSGTEYRDVDAWTLEHTMPDPGDGTKAVLWLNGITHTGLIGDDVSLPPVRFEGIKLPNRVYTPTGHAPLVRYRLSSIVSETGAVTTVTYAPADCAPGNVPAAADRNERRCYPAWWAPPGAEERMDWFHKYVVAAVAQVDTTGGSTTQVTSYDYLDGAAWHYDEHELTKPDRRTWSDWRGYGRVRVTAGNTNTADNVRTQSETRFFRGMHGDHLADGSTRTAKVSDSDPATPDVEDLPQYAGLTREEVVLDGVNGAVVSGTVHDPWSHGPTATRGALKSYMTRIGATHGRVALASGGWRRTETRTTYDKVSGVVTTVDNAGDTAVDGDETCTRHTYATNPGKWLLSTVSRTQTVAVPCAVESPSPDQLLGDSRISYDGLAWGAAPTKGNPTKGEQAKAETARYPDDFVTGSTSRYDAYGRVVEAVDAAERKITTAYTPATGGPVTKVEVTDPLGHKTTATIEPAWGATVATVDANQRRTDLRYDALGRLVEAWTPGFFKGTGDPANLRFSYVVRNDGPVVVSSERLGPNGNRVTSYALYDSHLRPRQQQAPAPGGGRVVTETTYDSQGRAYKSSNPYFNKNAPATDLVTAGDADIPGLTVVEYDGAGRATASIFKGSGAEKWRTTTRYGGDRTTVIPPAGGTGTTTLLDALGRPKELQRYNPANVAATVSKTHYSYDRAGQLESVVDPAGNEWRYDHDLLGRQTGIHDPDKGDSTLVYDDAGRLVSSTDARNIELSYEYDDPAGRKTEVRQGDQTLVEWTYDTATRGLGMPASATRWVDGDAYGARITSYHLTGQVRKSEVVIPSVPGEEKLAGTYSSVSNFRPDGSLSSVSIPAMGGLAAETLNHTYSDLGLPSTTYGSMSSRRRDYVTKSTYSPLGELSQLQLGSGTKRAWQTLYYQDDTRRLDRAVFDVETSQPMRADVNFSYDPTGNITRIADTPLNRPHDTQCFRYDHLRQLVEAWTPASDCAPDPSVAGLAGPAPYWQSFTYEPGGNRETEVQHAAAGDTSRSYDYPDPGEFQAHTLSSVTSSGARGATTDSFRYDGAGNTLERQVAGRAPQQMTWDPEGHLATVTAPEGMTSFVYAADGSRLLRRDPAGTTLYLGGQELRLDKASGSLTATRYYDHGGGSVAMRTPAGTTWLAADHQGTSQLAVDASTLALTQRRQTPFGTPRGDNPQFPGERGFVGGTNDPTTGLTHLGAREYDPSTGRFLSVDPVMDLSDPLQMQGYSYANNNPVTFSDPTGMLTCNKPDGWDCGKSESVDREGSLRCMPGRPCKQVANWRPGVPYGAPVTQTHKTQMDQMGLKPPLKWVDASSDEGQNATAAEQESCAARWSCRAAGWLVNNGPAVAGAVTGLADLQSCLQDRSASSCGMAAAGFFPVAKPFKLLKGLGKADDAADQPVHRQRWDDSCVAACGEIISGGKLFEYLLVAKHGRPLPPATLAAELTEKTGRAWTYGPKALDKLLARGPFVASTSGKHADGEAWKHAIVVDGLDAAGRLRIRDPGRTPGSYTLSVSEFQAQWIGFKDLGQGFAVHLDG